MTRRLAEEGRVALLQKARALCGKTIEELAQQIGADVPGSGLHHKGRIGTLLERALGATAGPTARPDFPDLGVELKTIPIDASGHPYESTFVCSVSLADAERAEWESSTAHSKLACVLWVPIVGHPSQSARERHVGAAQLWSPDDAQEAVLSADFDEIMGRIGAGGIEEISARMGRWLQLRPKARDGAERTFCFGPDGEWIATVPRGLYLRTRFTGAILANSRAMPE